MRLSFLLGLIPSLLFITQNTIKPYYEVNVVEKNSEYVCFKVWSKFDSTSIMIIKGEEINIVTDQTLPNFCIVNRNDLINNRLKITFVGESITSSLIVRYHSFYELVSFDNYKFYEGFYLESDEIVINQSNEGSFELIQSDRDYDIPNRKINFESYLHFLYTMKNDYIEQAYLLLYLPFQTYPNIPYSYKENGYALALKTNIDETGNGYFYLENDLFFKLSTFELSLEKKEGFMQSNYYLLPNSLKSGTFDVSLNIVMTSFRIKYSFTFYVANVDDIDTSYSTVEELTNYESDYKIK